jgi:hypothetical protein
MTSTPNNSSLKQSTHSWPATTLSESLLASSTQLLALALRFPEKILLNLGYAYFSCYHPLSP